MLFYSISFYFLLSLLASGSIGEVDFLSLVSLNFYNFQFLQFSYFFLLLSVLASGRIGEVDVLSLEAFNGQRWQTGRAENRVHIYFAK